MKDCYLGIDIGSISTKGVIIDEKNKILAKEYIWTEGNPLGATEKLVNKLKRQLEGNYQIRGIGTTGSGRKLVGLMLGANTIKNEITAHAVGTLTFYPTVRTILEIGGQDSKIIMLNNGIVTDYAMNTLCAAGTGSFLSSQSKRMEIPIDEFGKIALKSTNPAKIAARCTVFAESDLIHKAQVGYLKEDIVAGLCKSVVLNYLNNVAKGEKIKSPIVFQGGVSKNEGVVKYFKEVLNEEIITLTDGHLMGAIGIAVLARKNKTGKVYSLDLKKIKFETKAKECTGCSNSCEILKIYKNNSLIDSYGSKCGKF